MKDTNQLIISNRNVMMGKPVVAGTRITVELILDKLAAGETYEQILDAHPRLTLEGIQAALLTEHFIFHKLSSGNLGVVKNLLKKKYLWNNLIICFIVKKIL